MDVYVATRRRTAPLNTPTTFQPDAVKELSGALNLVLADFFALYLKTKNFHWHVSGPHFRDYHLLLDDQASEIFAVTDAVAERVRKIGGTTLRSIGHIARLQRVTDNDGEYVTPARDARGAARRQHATRGADARSTRIVRRVWRRRYSEPPRGMDRRSRKAGLVSVRGGPTRRRSPLVTDTVGSRSQCQHSMSLPAEVAPAPPGRSALAGSPPSAVSRFFSCA